MMDVSDLTTEQITHITFAWLLIAFFLGPLSRLWKKLRKGIPSITDAGWKTVSSAVIKLNAYLFASGKQQPSR